MGHCDLVSFGRRRQSCHLLCFLTIFLITLTYFPFCFPFYIQPNNPLGTPKALLHSFNLSLYLNSYPLLLVSLDTRLTLFHHSLYFIIQFIDENRSKSPLTDIILFGFSLSDLFSKLLNFSITYLSKRGSHILGVKNDSLISC